MKTNKQFGRKLCPAFLERRIRTLVICKRLVFSYIFDFTRFLRYSGVKGTFNQSHWDARITTLYHVLEKGLSMPEPRPGFGEEVAERLIRSIKQYLAGGYPEDIACIQSAISAIHAYMAFRQDDGTHISSSITVDWEDLQNRMGQHHDSVIIKKREEIVATANKPFDVFSSGRHSIRNYADQPIDESIIKKAVEISQRSPSACNRQPARVYSISSDTAIKQVLALQNGNRGFGQPRQESSHCERRLAGISWSKRTKPSLNRWWYVCHEPSLRSSPPRAWCLCTQLVRHSRQ